MTSKQRAMAALEFQEPDCVPVAPMSFWGEFQQMWQDETGSEEDLEEHFLVDIWIAVGNETPWPSLAGELGTHGEYRLERDGWGQVRRVRSGGYFYEQAEVAYDESGALRYGEFEPASLESRYQGIDAVIEERKRRYAVFAKVGGPFIRTGFMRGEQQWLMDLAADPQMAAEMAMRTARHIAAIGLEELRRWDLYDTGIWVYDDMAATKGPMFSPATAERVLAPAWAHLVESFKDAGARKVILHSDGNIGPLLDLFIDLGFDGINPVEYHTGLHPTELRERYGERLALLGGLDNAEILPRGEPQEVREHVLEVLSSGVGGGLAIGTHSIAPDISVATMRLVRELIVEYGQYPLRLP
ncbi:MAG: uroporphyrinogen decarboxylase family protein [Armatimonadota bacterium]|nr:uroporphyrinogen decarboxylase family protein [Armatimonadota bacterium]